MTGVEILGAMAAAGQFLEQCFNVAAVGVDLRSKMKVGPRSAHEQALNNQKLVDIYVKILQNTSVREYQDPFCRSCLEDAIQLRDVFEGLSVTTRDSSMKRFIKAVEWKAKEKEIFRLCRSIRDKRATLSLSLITVLPGIVSGVSLLNEYFSQFSSAVESQLAELSLQVAALRHARPQPEFPSIIDSPSLANSCNKLRITPPMEDTQLVGRKRKKLASSLDRTGCHNQIARENNIPALQWKIATSSEEYLVTFCYMNSFAIDLLDQRKYTEAEDMHRLLLIRRTTVLGPEHAHTLASITNVSYCLQLQDRLEAAKALAEDAVTKKEKVLGSDNVDTLLSFNNLGVILHLQGDFERAKEMHSKVASGRKKVLGRYDPDTLISIGNLAGAFFKQQNFAQALKMARKVYDSNLQVRERDDPETIKSLSNLASVLEHMENYQEAEQMRKQVLRLREDVLGHEHPDTKASARKLETLLQCRKNRTNTHSLTSNLCRGRAKCDGRSEIFAID